MTREEIIKEDIKAISKKLSVSQDEVAGIIKKISESISTTEDEAVVIVEKSVAGGEVDGGLQLWFENRFLPNVVFIDEDGYAEMCIDALKILGKTAPTDFGSSRQRDLGQLWADMTRGYLGELAFKQFLGAKGVAIKLGHEVGELADYLPNDIHLVKKSGEDWREPKLKLSIKTTKWNGIWLDIPGDQFNHSDAYVLIKVGTGRDHLFAYFKKISVFKDKILKKGKDIGLLSESDADNLYNNLPTFKKIPAYVCGFCVKPSGSNGEEECICDGKKGRLNFNITKWSGPITPEKLAAIKQERCPNGKMRFEGIGEFAHDRGYLYNAGSLKWSKDDWQPVIDRI